MLRKRGWACFVIAVGFSVVSACGDDAGDGTDTATSADETSASGDTTEPTTGDDTVDPSDNSDTARASSTNADSTSDETNDDTSAETGPTRGAVSMHVVPKGDCSLGDTWVDFPEVESGHPVTATAHDTLSENLTFDDQGRTVEVSCRWIDSGETTTYLMSVSARSSTDSELFSAQAALGSGAVSEGPVTFGKSEQLPQWRAPSEHRCLFSAMQLSVESVWGTFTCPIITDGEVGEECEVTEGHFYFENCIPRQ